MNHIHFCSGRIEKTMDKIVFSRLLKIFVRNIPSYLIGDVQVLLLYHFNTFNNLILNS